MKSSGFNVEDTHLTHLDRIERLFAIMIIAFTWAYLTGIHKHLFIVPIRILKHGRRAKSIFKLLLSAKTQKGINIPPEAL